MQCGRCNGRAFLDRTFSENKNFEVFCILCGERRFIEKNSELGQWLAKKETELAHARSILN